MAYATLVGLRLQSRLGFIQRDVIVPESITVFNLHKVLQFALNCRQTDDGIASKASSLSPSIFGACDA